MKVICGGCFNHLHPGHIYFFNQCSAYGELFVIVAHDKNNNKLNKISAQKRLSQLENLKMIKNLKIGSQDDFSKLVKKIKPQVICLGYDQELPSKVLSIIKKDKIKIKRMKKLPDYKKDFNSFLGRIFSGEKKAGSFLNTPIYKNKIESVIKKEIYPGTLNLNLGNKNYLKNVNKKKMTLIRGFKEGDREFGDIYIYPIKIKSIIDKEPAFKRLKVDLRAWVVKAQKTMYNEEIIEIIHPQNLRKKFNLADDQLMEIKF
ncbi:MAG: DUF120 domain-containing protein [Candidatus Moranbacteria bacterium]|nr:DUF120 domain-containing protein [Candidatus Moranbacteria bacterium]